MKQWQSDNNQCTMAKGKFILTHCSTENTTEEKLNADQISNHLNSCCITPHKTFCKGDKLLLTVYLNVFVYKSLFGKLKKKT